MQYIKFITLLIVLLAFNSNSSGQKFERISPIPNIDTSAYSLNPRYLTIFKNNLYFFGTDDLGLKNGNKLWKSNGTWSGTSVIKQINNGDALYPNLFNLTAFSNFMLFIDLKNKTTWRSDGTVDGTFKLTDFYGANFIEWKDKVYFISNANTIGLWETDGTIAGTKLIKSLNSIAEMPSSMIVYNNRLYFGATDDTSFQQLWVSDGTTSGTTILKTINDFAHSNIGEFIELNGYLYFRAKSNGSDNQIWRTNGTKDSTIKITTKCSGCHFGLNPQNSIKYNNKLYFKGADGNGLASQLWVSDGTDTGTSIIHSEIIGSSSFPDGFLGNSFEIIQNNGLLYFNGYDTTGTQVWQSDGTDTGTKRITHFSKRLPFNLMSYNNHVFFIASSPYSQYDNQLYYIQGDSERILYYGPNDDPFWRLKQDRNSDRFVEYKGALFFPCTYDFWSQFGLWKFSFDVTDIPLVNYDKKKTNIYPNPLNNNSINIRAIERSEYSIYDLSGTIIQKGFLISGENTIELPQKIANGIYFVQIGSNYGNTTQKLILNR